MRWMFALALVAGACGLSSTASEPGPASSAGESTTASSRTTTTVAVATTPTTVATTPSTVDPILEQVRTMSVRDKIGQMLMPVVAGTGVRDAELTDAQRAYNMALGGVATPGGLVTEFGLGGVMYLGPNVESPAQIARFSEDLQAVASSAGLPEILIAADQEGGRVRRIRGEGITDLPVARELTGRPREARRLNAIVGRELRSIGVTVDFAPVADVARTDEGVIGTRSFGPDPVADAVMVGAVVEGLQRGGVAAVAKHWPGHGDTSVDSHESLPVLDLTEEEWRSVDRMPFARAVELGVDAIMVGHLAVPAIDPSAAPATFSPILTHELIREDLGFDGVLFSDALDMRALDGVAEDEVAVRVVEAGIDILLVPPDLDAARRGIEAAVASGRLTEERLDSSVVRILRLKATLALDRAPSD